MKYHKAAGIILLLLISPFILKAEGGIVYLVKGYLKLRQQDTEKIYRKVGEEIPVFKQDRIQTGIDTEVRIFLRAKGEEIVLRSKTLFVISDLTPKQTKLSLNFGKAWFKVNPLMQEQVKKRNRRFILRTSTALVGVKGTEFVVASTTEGTKLLTLSGMVTFASLINPDVEVQVTKNQVSKVLKDKLPTTPIRVSEEEKQRILKSDSPSRLGRKMIKPKRSKSRKSKPIDSITSELDEDVEDIMNQIKALKAIGTNDIHVHVEFQ
jgi:chaperonin cofactor prefoldin